ncbi:TonB-dependent receptor [Trichocoleus sp. Lan]|uniref:TonB-dependent receptor domain-containing protein n=1 Tax=Trichocoleus sp. Lan TaxID=2933927 RepID=UPI00329A1FA5
MNKHLLFNSFLVANAVAVLVCHPVLAEVTQVTSIRLIPTSNGIQVILETTGGTLSRILTSSNNDIFTANIINAQLSLPEGNRFYQNNPTDAITAVSVTPLDSNSIQVVIIGKAGIPPGEVNQSDSALIFNLDNTTDSIASEPDSESDETPEAFESSELATEPEVQVGTNEEIELVVTAKREIFPETSTPVYTINQEEIQKQGANSAAEVLRGLPGFAINDAGFGADIHTGTYYRGHSINQSVFLLNGRPINTNINTYHGATDLNSIPVEAIEQVELSSGTSSTLYGSEAFGGVVNIITKQGQEVPKLNASVEYGSFNQSNYRISYGGSADNLRFNLGYEEYEADNRYAVPKGAANRDSEGLLFNGDTATSNYFGGISLDLNSRNTLSLDASKISSRRGLLYFGFPLQRDRLDHDAFNIGLSWKALLGEGEDSVLRTTLSYNQDYFNTYGPTQNIFYRTGTLNSQALNARVEHQWQTSPRNTLTWGFDVQNSYLNGNVLSTVPNQLTLNESENRDRFHTAIFALNTWKISNSLQADFGLRQNFNSDFGSYLNPSVGGRWAVTPTVAVRGSWASVQRNPGLDQLYVFDTVHNWLPNPDLNPETGSSWTAGVDIQFLENLVGQFTYFGSRLDNRLGVISGRWANIGLVNTNGLEAALRWQMTPQWSTFLNYTYTDARIETGLEKGLQLGLIPYSVGQFGIGYASGGWQLNLYASYHGGARRAFFNNPGESNKDFSPSFLNLDLSGRIPITKNFGITVNLENLADVRYEKANRIYHPGLTLRVGLQSNF